MAHILLAEDEANVYALIRQRLRRLGHEVTWAQDGQQALDMIRERSPDLLLLDLMMPSLPGLAVLQRLRADPQTQRLPVIILTARGHDQDMASALESGADDYIVKPFSFPELVARVNVLLARSIG